MKAFTRFWVPGDPKPKGSLRNVARRGTRPRMIEQVQGSTEWRVTIADVASEVWVGPALDKDVAVEVELEFWFARPVSHYRPDRIALAKHAPAYPVYAKMAGDADKLARNVLDALKDAGVYADDAQVSDLHSKKRYLPGSFGLGVPGVWVTVALLVERPACVSSVT